jgi:hypothetical protein
VHLDPAWLVHPVVARILTKRLSANGEPASGSGLLAEFQGDEPASRLLSSVLAEERPIPEPAKQLRDVLTHLRNNWITAQIQQLTRQLAHPDVADADRIALLQRQNELRQLKRRPLGE